MKIAIAQHKTTLPEIREIQRFTSDYVNSRLRDTFLSHRPWTAFGADLVELCLRHTGDINKDEHYIGFDSETEELLFKSNPFIVHSDVFVRLTLWQHLRQWWRERVL